MPADPPRVLVTGAGGPSGISILRALEDTPLTLLAGDIDPFAAGLYLVDATRRSILPRGDDPRFTDDLLARCEREAIDVLVPTVDSELLPLARRREEFAAAGVTLVLASEATLAVCLDKWALAERCHGRVRGPATVVVDARVRPASIPLPAIVKPRSGSGSRGIRLLERRAELEALERDGTLLVQEHLPGPGVLARRARPRRRPRRRGRAARAAEGRLGDRGHGPDAARRCAGRASPARSPQAIELTSVANVQVKLAADGEPALLEVNARFPGTMPLTVAAGVLPGGPHHLRPAHLR